MRVPEYEAHDWPNDMYMAHVEDHSAEFAALRAQRVAADDFGESVDDADDEHPNPDDFIVLLVVPQIPDGGIYQLGDHRR